MAFGKLDETDSVYAIQIIGDEGVLMLDMSFCCRRSQMVASIILMRDLRSLIGLSIDQTNASNVQKQSIF